MHRLRRLRSGLPDHGDPTVRAQLECSACKALVAQLYDDLNQLYDLRHGRPKHYEVVEVTEHMCARVRDTYGGGSIVAVNLIDQKGSEGELAAAFAQVRHHIRLR